MFEKSLSIWTQVGIVGQAVVNEVLEILRPVTTNRICILWTPFHYTGDRISLLTIKDWLTSNELICKHSKRPDVYFRSVRSPTSGNSEHLGSYPMHRSLDFSLLIRLAVD